MKKLNAMHLVGNPTLIESEDISVKVELGKKDMNDNKVGT